VKHLGLEFALRARAGKRDSEQIQQIEPITFDFAPENPRCAD